jgi:hypothetical protein
LKGELTTNSNFYGSRVEILGSIVNPSVPPAATSPVQYSATNNLIVGGEAGWYSVPAASPPVLVKDDRPNLPLVRMSNSVMCDTSQQGEDGPYIILLFPHLLS